MRRENRLELALGVLLMLISLAGIIVNSRQAP